MYNSDISFYFLSTFLSLFLTSKNPSVAVEAGLLDGAEDGVVDAGFTGDGVPQPLQRIVTGVLYGGHLQGGRRQQTWKKRQKRTELMAGSIFAEFKLKILRLNLKIKRRGRYSQNETKDTNDGVQICEKTILCTMENPEQFNTCH